MKKIKILIMMLFCVVASGCGISYERDPSEGSIIEISYEQVETLMKDDETFIMFFSQTNCQGCIAYKEMLEGYLQNHHVTIYEFNFTNYEGTPEEKSKLFLEDLPQMIQTLTEDKDQHFIGTPYTLVMVDGELKEGLSGALENDEFEDLVVEYQLDEKKK